jgi:exopolysaccharide biosynthesis polyprenyl glycosylphosphotransferase
MTSTTSLSLKSKLDLRASVLTQLSRRTGGNWRRLITLFLLDATVLVLAWQIAESYGTSLDSYWNTQDNPFALWPIIATQIGLIAAEGLYNSGEKRRDYFKLIKALTLSHVLLLLIAFFYQPGDFVSRSTFILSWLLSISLTCITRLSVDTAIKHLRKQGVVRGSTFLICRSEDREKAVKLLGQENCYNLLGWADVNSLAVDIHSLDATLEHVYHLGVAEVFVCSWQSIKSRMFLYWKLRTAGITLHILPIELETIDQNLELKMVGRLPALKLSPPLITGGDFLVKRCFDFCCATLFVLLALPLYLFIALLIKLDSPGPVFYKQTRIGLHGEPFKVWKFRTMVANADQLQKDLEASNEMKDGVLFKMKKDPRITRVGKFLRRYSLDELPQLFNVLFGEMSLVGPRPLPVRDVEKFSEHHFIRHEVLPGITGLWQVSGRSDITDFEEVVRLDVTYMESWSLSLDLQILLQTITVILGKKGAY